MFLSNLGCFLITVIRVRSSLQNSAWGRCHFSVGNEVGRILVARATAKTTHRHRRKAQNRLIFRRVFERNDCFACRAMNDVIPCSSFLQVRGQIGSINFLLPSTSSSTSSLISHCRQLSYERSSCGTIWPFSPGLLHRRFLRPPPSVTPNLIAFWCVAPTLRLSLRAITLVFVFSRARPFNIRTSSFVHVRTFKGFFAISVPHASMLANESPERW